MKTSLSLFVALFFAAPCLAAPVSTPKTAEGGFTPAALSQRTAIKKVRLIQTANFYFYDANGTHLTITRYSYQ
jgi:hypothetical protein